MCCLLFDDFTNHFPYIFSSGGNSADTVEAVQGGQAKSGKSVGGGANTRRRRGTRAKNRKGGKG